MKSIFNHGFHKKIILAITSLVFFITEKTYPSSSYAADNKFEIYLVGAFEGDDFSFARLDSRRFSYFNNDNVYSLEFYLYQDDIFCPYIVNPNGKFIYADQDETNYLVHNENLTTNSSGYFVCLQEGYYKIVIRETVFDFDDLSLSWKEGNGSIITKTKNKKSRSSCLGNLNIYLTGIIDGIQYGKSSSPFKFTFSEDTNEYFLKINLKKEDFFDFYISETNQYVDYLFFNSYAKKMFDSAHLSYNSYKSRNHFLVEKSGSFLISFSEKIETLEKPSDIWKIVNFSKIEYLSEYDSSFYLCLDDIENNTNFVSKFSLNNELQNFKLIVNCVPNVSVYSARSETYRKLLRIDYEAATENIFSLKRIKDNGKEILINGKLENSSCYFVDDFGGNNIGNIAKFMNLLSDYSTEINMHNEDFIKNILSQYDNLDDSEKELVNKCLVKPNETEVLVKEFVNDIKKELDDGATFFIILIISLFIFTGVVGLVLIFPMKRRV